MTWPEPMPIVEVDWIDSMQHSGWRVESEWKGRIDAHELECRSAGYLYRDDRQSVVLVQSLSRAGSMADMIEIPRRAVRAVRTIRPAEGGNAG